MAGCHRQGLLFCIRTIFQHSDGPQQSLVKDLSYLCSITTHVSENLPFRSKQNSSPFFNRAVQLESTFQTTRNLDLDSNSRHSLLRLPSSDRFCFEGDFILAHCSICTSFKNMTILQKHAHSAYGSRSDTTTT